MATNLRAFNIALSKEQKECVEDALVLFHKKLTFDALSIIVPLTPVKTGRARGEWQTAIGSSNEATLGRLDPAATESIRDGINRIAALQPFQVVFIFNNIHYIKLLEHGHSRQSKLMVATAFQRLRNVREKVRIA